MGIPTMTITVTTKNTHTLSLAITATVNWSNIFRKYVITSKNNCMFTTNQDIRQNLILSINSRERMLGAEQNDERQRKRISLNQWKQNLTHT